VRLGYIFIREIGLKTYVPDVSLYDSFLVSQFNESCLDTQVSLYEPLAAVYTRRKNIFSSLDAMYGGDTIRPFAFIEYLLYHRTGNKKRLRTILPVLDIELDRIATNELDTLLLAINYLYMSAMAKMILDPMLEFKYTKLWYGCKNHIKEWDAQYNHLAMLAELAPIDCMPIGDNFLAVKALEKYGRFFEARGMALRIMYDSSPCAALVPLCIESVMGIHLSTAKKTFDFIAPDSEKFAVYGLKLGHNMVSVSYEPGRLSINTDKILYAAICADGYELKRIPIPGTGSCTIKL